MPPRDVQESRGRVRWPARCAAPRGALLAGVGALLLAACPAPRPRADLPMDEPVRLDFTHPDHFDALAASCDVCHAPRSPDRTRGLGDMGLVSGHLCALCHVESAAVRREARPARLARSPAQAKFVHARHTRRLDRLAPGATCRTCHRFPAAGAATAGDLAVPAATCAECHDD